METYQENSHLQAVSKIHSGGRLIIPSQLREALHFSIGDEVQMIAEAGELKVISRIAAIRRAQELVAKYIPSSVSLVDELIAERRAEAAREAAEMQSYGEWKPAE